MQNAQLQVVIKSDGEYTEYFLHFDLAELYTYLHVSIDVRWQLA